MYKKHIKSFNKGLAIGLETVCAFALLLAIMWFALIIRLSYGPMDVNYLTNTIEETVNNENLGFNFDVTNTSLKWGGSNTPMEFEMKGVQVSREDNTPILAIEKIGVQLSRRHLLIGKIVPKVVKIYGPALRVVRDKEGKFSLNVSKFVKRSAGDDEDKSDIDQNEVLKSIILIMKDSEDIPFISRLDQIAINEASMLYQDEMLGVGWKSKKSNVIFTKKYGGIEVDTIASLDMDKEDVGYFKGSLFYSWDTLKTNGIFYFTNFNLAELSQQSEMLDALSEVNLDFKGSMAFELDTDLKLVYSRFVMGADKGSLNIAGLYKKPIEVSDIYLKGKSDSYDKKISFEEFKFKLNDAEANIVGSVEDSKNGKIAILDATLNNLPVDDLSIFWPDSLQDVARSWVVENITTGTAKKATLHSILLANNNDFNNVELIDINGAIDFEGIEVNYFSPLRRVTDVKGRATYDDKTFFLDIKSGKLDDVRVKKSKIVISDLDKVDAVTDALIDIDIDLNGPLITALKVIDSKPLRYPRQLGLDINDFSGNADMNLKFNFPLNQKLKVEDVVVQAKADVSKMQAKDIVEDFDISADKISVFVDNNHMVIKGKGLLEEMPVDFNWQNNFTGKAKEKTALNAKVNLTKDALLRFGMPEDLHLEGTVPANLKYIVAKDKKSKMDLSLDVTKASFELPLLNYRKEADMSGKAKMYLHFNKQDKVEKISGLKYSSKTDEISGGLNISPKDKQVVSAKFDRIKLGNNDFSMKVSKDDNFYHLDIKGRKLDVTDILSSHKSSSEKGVVAQEKATPIIADISVKKLVTSKDGTIDNTKIHMRTDEWERVKKLEIDAEAGNKPLYVRYIPQIQGGYSLEFKAYNAGAALSALDITDSVKGGRLEVRGFPDIKSGNRDLAGTVNISDFTLTDVPVLGMLLNSMSLVGVVELLNGKGINFNKMGAKFWWKDKGMPDYKTPVRKIVLKDGETSGASLGLTFDGHIDMLAKQIKMNGTVIPASGISKFVGKIPLLGDILTGGDGGGIIAATYKIKGDTSNPNVSVNPLSVLAPGVIRKLFFE